MPASMKAIQRYVRRLLAEQTNIRQEIRQNFCWRYLAGDMESVAMFEHQSRVNALETHAPLKVRVAWQ